MKTRRQRETEFTEESAKFFFYVQRHTIKLSPSQPLQKCSFLIVYLKMKTGRHFALHMRAKSNSKRIQMQKKKTQFFQVFPRFQVSVQRYLKFRRLDGVAALASPSHSKVEEKTLTNLMYISFPFSTSPIFINCIVLLRFRFIPVTVMLCFMCK